MTEHHDEKDIADRIIEHLGRARPLVQRYGVATYRVAVVVLLLYLASLAADIKADMKGGVYVYESGREAVRITNAVGEPVPVVVVR